MFSIHKLEDGENKLDKFDKNKIAKLSTILEYKENPIDSTLKAGKYMIVPSTKHSGDVGNYFLNIYFNTTGDDEMDKNGDFVNFKCTYINPSPNDIKEYMKWEIIAEEDESQSNYNDTFLRLL